MGIVIPSPDSSGAALALTGVTKRFGEAAAVKDVTFDVPAGSFLVLLGPSGCGKTTLLRMLAGLEQPTSGRIEIGDRCVYDSAHGIDMPPGRRGVGLVFQSYALWPHMTVSENVTWPLRVARVPAAERTRRVDETLSTLAIGHLADRFPSQLSGGQQQRVAIARTIASRPKLLLLDEPLSNLDAALRHEMRGELARLHRLHGTTTVHVTHDQLEAITLASHIALLSLGEVVQIGPPSALLERPRDAFVAAFVGNPPYVVVEAELARRAGCVCPDGQVAVRPERLEFTDGPGLTGIVLESSPLADRWLTNVAAEGARLTVLSARRPGQAPGEEVTVAFPTSADHTFARTG